MKQGTTKFIQPLYDDQDENDIDQILKDELTEKGLEYRFIDYKKAQLNGGRSRAGWYVYKRDSEDPRLQGIKALSDPDGLVRQGTMVLAVKTNQSAERQRSKRDSQNQTLRKYNELKTNEIGSEANKLGGSRVIAGYEKNS